MTDLLQKAYAKSGLQSGGELQIRRSGPVRRHRKSFAVVHVWMFT